MKKASLALIGFLFTLALFAGTGNASSPSARPGGAVKQVSSCGQYEGYCTDKYKGFAYKSYYVPTRDSVLLAVDVLLPKHLEKGKKIPAILYPTRYNRSIKAKFPFSLFKDPVLVIVSEEEVKFFTSHGYACVIVDARGSGASTGQRQMEFSPAEMMDGKDVADWIVKQPWCNGSIGTSGISYGATAAEMLLANQHPSIKACVPRSGIFDLYGDVMYPGGVCQGPFVDVWSFTTKSLDNNNYGVFGKQAKNLVQGIHPVKGDKHHAILKQAIADHKKNFDVFAGLKTIRFRDDFSTSLNARADDFSNHTLRDKIEKSGAAIYRIGGWYDGSLAKSCTDGFQSTANTKKVLLGPWDHGPQSNVSPFALGKKIEFSVYTEMLRFLDYHLKGIDNGIQNEPAVTYYTIGEESWKASNTWPPVNTKTQKFFLSADNGLSGAIAGVKSGAVNYKVDYTATTGNTSRWNSVTKLYMNGPTNYVNRAEEDKKLVSFTSPALTQATEITGHPVINLRFSADANDATVFCYLEDVAPDGSVTYVTEGLLRASSRKLSNDLVYKTAYPDHSFRKEDDMAYTKGEEINLAIDMLPISYQFKKDHKVRVSIAGADAGHFDLPEQKPENFTINCTQDMNPSFIELPVVEKEGVSTGMK